MSDISAVPVDLWLSIFQKLEAKTLGVCKCVCKQWCNVISSPYFIDYRLNLAKSSTSTNLRRSEDVIRAFPFSKKVSHHFDEVVEGLSGGIYWFSVFMKEEEEEEEGDYSKCRLMLWNPAIRKCMVLYTIDYDRLYRRFSMLVQGFGYEPDSNDYKFVLITGHSLIPRDRPLTVQVYSIRRGTWRSFPLTIPHLRIAGNSALFACVDGVMYWKIYVQGLDQAYDDYNCGQVILTFDLRNEAFGIMELPEEEIEELEDDMYERRGMFDCSEYSVESLALWDKRAKPAPWSRGVSVIQAEDWDLECTY